MKTVVFTVNARCAHGDPLPIGEDKCNLCKWEEYVLGNQPPFKVRCINDTGVSEIKDGETYTVVAVIERGKLIDSKTHLPCFLLRTEQKHATTTGFSIRRFELA